MAVKCQVKEKKHELITGKKQNTQLHNGNIVNVIYWI